MPKSKSAPCVPCGRKSPVFSLDTAWAMEQTALMRMTRAVSCDAPEAVERLSAARKAFHAGRHLDDEENGQSFQRVGRAAIIHIRGVMEKAPSLFSFFFGGNDMRQTGRMIQAAARDKEIRSIVLLIDSPGGTVDGTKELADAVAAAAQEKRVIAQVDGMAASAAFWVASQATQIFAQPTDMVGSIGVILPLLDISKNLEEDGVELVTITTGKFKAAGMLGTEITEEQRAEFQKLVDGRFEIFTAAVAKGRGMSPKVLAPLADGRMFLAKNALTLGLIDGIRTIEATLARVTNTTRKE